MRKLVFGAVTLAACSQLTQPQQQPPPVPWLKGFVPNASNDVPGAGIPGRIQQWKPCDEPCADYAGVELTTDLAPSPGAETILATFSQGVVVLDGSGKLLASGPGLDPTGSADEILGVATGDAPLGATTTPIIAVTARAGGHRENEIWLELFRVGRDHHLDRVFAGVVEEHDDGGDHRGSVTLERDRLLYNAPRATTATAWTFDEHLGRFTYRREIP